MLGVIAVLSSFVLKPFDNIETGPKKNFTIFLSYFEKVDTPKEINFQVTESDENVKLKTNIASTSPIVEEYIFNRKPIRFSRMVPPLITPIARFYPTQNHVAVIYKSSLSFKHAGSEFHLKIFDLNGNAVLKKNQKNGHAQPVAMRIAFNNFRNVASFKPNQDGSFVIEEFKLEWRKDIDTHGFHENEVIAHHFEKYNRFRISAEGQIQKLPEDKNNERAQSRAIDFH